jgi:hypothetical protein
MSSELFGMKSHGAITGYTVFAFSLEGAFGNYMAGAMFDYIGNYHLVFSTFGVLVGAAIIVAVSLKKVKKRKSWGS